MITVEPDPSLRPEEVEPLLEELQRRVGAALERAVEGVGATVRIDDVGLSYVREVPVFPVAAGPRVFRDSSEIAEEVEALGAADGIGGVVHDATGRAFRCNVSTGLARLPAEIGRSERCLRWTTGEWEWTASVCAAPERLVCTTAATARRKPLEQSIFR